MIVHDDTGAIEGLPLQLLLAVVVASLSIPAIMGMAGSVASQRMDEALETETLLLRDMMETLGPTGNGTSVPYTIVIPSSSLGGSVSFARLGAERSSPLAMGFTYELSGHNVRTRVVSPVPIHTPVMEVGSDGDTSIQGSGLSLGSGDNRILLTVNEDGYGRSIIVTRLE